MAQTQETDIDLYTASTPNGHKINILFEELGIKYKWHAISFDQKQQKEDWYLKINPNGRIPAIVDKTGGQHRRVFEGASIMLYLCEKYDTQHKISFAYDTDEYWESLQWLVWMQSGLGPMQGQSNHFYRYAPEKIPYAIRRYQTETKRLYQVIEDRLAAQQSAGKGLWLVGGRYTITDLACFSWVNWAEWAGVELGPFPKLEEWLGVIQARPATERGVNIPKNFEMKEAMKTKEGAEAYAKKHGNWALLGQSEDQAKFK